MELRDYFLLFIGELRCHEKLPDYLALTIYRSLKKTPIRSSQSDCYYPYGLW